MFPILVKITFIFTEGILNRELPITTHQICTGFRIRSCAKMRRRIICRNYSVCISHGFRVYSRIQRNIFIQLDSENFKTSNQHKRWKPISIMLRQHIFQFITTGTKLHTNRKKVILAPWIELDTMLKLNTHFSSNLMKDTAPRLIQILKPSRFFILERTSSVSSIQVHLEYTDTQLRSKARKQSRTFKRNPAN